jgi:ppGpp synthetase/RelA/SpoT-type nucleotidyltranferase
MRLTEFWARMDHHLGPAYARTWAETQVVRELNGRTVAEALADGEAAKVVWRAVWAHLNLPPSER